MLTVSSLIWVHTVWPRGVLNISADDKNRWLVTDFYNKIEGIQSCYIHIDTIMLSVTLNGSLTFKTSALQMQALIKNAICGKQD